MAEILSIVAVIGGILSTGNAMLAREVGLILKIEFWFDDLPVLMALLHETRNILLGSANTVPPSIAEALRCC